MDARTGVERQPQSISPRVAAGRPKDPSEVGVAVVDVTAPWAAPTVRGREGAAHLSPDPMRATDRYRLVMPYDARV